MDEKRVAEAFELLTIELEYAVCDLMFAQQDDKQPLVPKELQSACAQIVAARHALALVKDLVGRNLSRPELHLAER